MTNTITLFTDSTGLELFQTGKVFYAENTPLTDAGDLYTVVVEEAVKLNIMFEKDGLQVFKINPNQVISIN